MSYEEAEALMCALLEGKQPPTPTEPVRKLAVRLATMLYNARTPEYRIVQSTTGTCHRTAALLHGVASLDSEDMVVLARTAAYIPEIGAGAFFAHRSAHPGAAAALLREAASSSSLDLDDLICAISPTCRQSPLARAACAIAPLTCPLDESTLGSLIEILSTERADVVEIATVFLREPPVGTLLTTAATVSWFHKQLAVSRALVQN